MHFHKFFTNLKKKLKNFQSGPVSGDATTSQNQSNTTNCSVKVRNSPPNIIKNRRDLVWISPSLKQVLQAHVQKNIDQKKNLTTKNVVNNNKNFSVNEKINHKNNNLETPTDNLTTLTSTHDDSNFVKPKKFIKRNLLTKKIEQQKNVRRQPTTTYDRSKFKYLAPHMMLKNMSNLGDKTHKINNNNQVSGSVSPKNKNNTEECNKDSDKMQEVVKRDK